jgi:hypothetical protein
MLQIYRFHCWPMFHNLEHLRLDFLLLPLLIKFQVKFESLLRSNLAKKALPLWFLFLTQLQTHVLLAKISLQLWVLLSYCHCLLKLFKLTLFQQKGILVFL